MNADAAADRAEDAYWRMLGERFLTENPRNGRKFVLRVYHCGSSHIVLKDLSNLLLKNPCWLSILLLLLRGHNDRQVIPFSRALFKILSRRTVLYEYVTISTIRKYNWTPELLVDWLLDSEAHFILCHLHQGLKDIMWNMANLAAELKKLFYHPGLENQLSCPIFLQVGNRYAFDNILRITLLLVG